MQNIFMCLSFIHYMNYIMQLNNFTANSSCDTSIEGAFL